jgi:hypothetical protein
VTSGPGPAAHATDPAAPAVFFVHVMKTGGTTVFRHLRLNYPLDALYPYRELDIRHDGDTLDIRNHLSVSYLRGLSPERHAGIRVYTGHFPYVTSQLLGRPVTTVTVLRDPVARTVSLLRQLRRGTPWLDPGNRPPLPLPLEEVYEHPLVFEPLIHNHQTKIFSMTEADQPESYMDVVEMDETRLERAKGTLAEVDVLGLTEEFDHLLDAVSVRLGWDIDRGARRNATPAADVGPVSDTLLRRIAEDNALDVALHEHARRLHDERRPRSSQA